MTMKNLLFIFTLFIALTGSGQNANSYLRARAENNYKLLAKGQSIRHMVTIDDKGIHIKKLDGASDLSVYWSEMPRVISQLETLPYYDMVRGFESKGTQRFFHTAETQTEVSHYRDFPTEMGDLYVALDPGHFGGNLSEAKMESRLVRMKAADVYTDKDIEFYEADLNYQTALFIREELQKLGANVLITRTYKSGALGKGFSKWMREDAAGDILEAQRKKDIREEEYQKLTSSLLDTAANTNRYNLFNFYKFLDLRARAHKINDFNPNVTLILHYNGSEEGRPVNLDRYFKPVMDDYNMMFIPGAFMDDEIKKADHKLDFIRLLLSPDLENSALLADYMLENLEQQLKVPRMRNAPSKKMDGSVINAQYPGVFSRNLYLTRAIRGTVVYAEALIQDNGSEAVKLSTKDVVVEDVNFNKIKASSRCKQVAHSYVLGIQQFLEENKKKKAEYLAATAGTK